MAITISPETEARLRQRAEREGADVNTVADILLAAALEWDEEERRAAIAGIRRGLEASNAGRVRSADDVFADMRARLTRSGG